MLIYELLLLKCKGRWSLLIKIILRNGFYYKGIIIKEDNEFLFIKDIKGKEVQIRKEDISVKEVEGWKSLIGCMVAWEPLNIIVLNAYIHIVNIARLEKNI